MQEKQEIKPTGYYCIKSKPDCNSQGLAQCDFCVWLVEQIKKARQEGIKKVKENE